MHRPSSLPGTLENHNFNSDNRTNSNTDRGGGGGGKTAAEFLCFIMLLKPPNGPNHRPCMEECTGMKG